MNNKLLQQKLNRAKRLAETPFKDLEGVTFNNPPSNSRARNGKSQKIGS